MHTFETPTPIAAVLEIPAGRVQIIAGDRTDTTVRVQPADAAKGRDVKAAERTIVEYSDGVLRIGNPQRNEILGSSGSVEVTVQVPAGSSLEVKAASAELRGAGRFGEVAYDGAHGAIDLGEIAGARITTQAGDVVIGRLNGPARISTAKGDIRIGEAVRGELVLSTQAGDVTVGAAPGVSASLDAGTSYGRIHNSLKNTGGTPELTIHATTAAGDIAARSR
jgi:DUF4097 and DUF4098 domain-containing protein YvlB